MIKINSKLIIVLCITLVFSSISAFADTADGKILTLEEAKELALKNDVQFNLQQSYIQQASENYDEVYESNTKKIIGKYSNIADKAAAEVSQNVAIENAASGIRKAIFNRDDLKRASDYNVTDAFYGVIKEKYATMDAEADMELKKKELETARIKYSISIITKNSLTQAETAFTASQTAYNKAYSELQNSLSQLSKNIGKNLDASTDQLDMALSVPDIKSLELNKIKEDHLKNNSSFYSAKEQYDLAEYKLLLTQEQYDYYYEKLSVSSTVRDRFDDILYEAQRDFDDVKYSYSEKVKDLDVTLSSQYTNIKNLYENYENQKKELEDAKLTIAQNRIKYQMGILTKAELESSEASLKEKENQLQTSIASLNIQYVSMTQYDLQQ